MTFISSLKQTYEKSSMLMLHLLRRDPLSDGHAPFGLFSNPVSMFVRVPTEHVDKSYFILTTMNYEVIEQSMDKDKFHIVATWKNSTPAVQHYRSFKKISISIKGQLQNGSDWKIQLKVTGVNTRTFFSSTRRKYAKTILEDLTQALGWKAFLLDKHSPSTPQSQIDDTDKLAA